MESSVTFGTKSKQNSLQVSDPLPSTLQDLLVTPSTVEWAVSESVQEHAKAVYQELATLLQSTTAYCHDINQMQALNIVQSYVRRCIPSLVALMESLEMSQTCRSEAEVQLELAREDSSALLKQYHREKEARRRAEQRAMEVEDAFEIERDEVQRKLDELEESARHMEFRMRKADELVHRCQQREQEVRDEMEQLQRRYREVLRKQQNPTKTNTTVEKCHRAIQVNSAEEWPQSFIHLDIEEKELRSPVYENSGFLLPQESGYLSSSNAHLLTATEDLDYHQLIAETDESITDSRRSSENKMSPSSELQLQLKSQFKENVQEELEELLKENEELVATKNALNIVNHDLIARLDEVNFEVAQLQNALQKSQEQESKSQERMQQMDEEMKDLREKLVAMEEKNLGLCNARPGERSVFTREEMTRVLTERNQYKERLLDLEESVRRYHTLRCGAEEEGNWKQNYQCYSQDIGQEYEGSSTLFNNQSSRQIPSATWNERNGLVDSSSTTPSVWWELFSLLLGTSSTPTDSSIPIPTSSNNKFQSQSPPQSPSSPSSESQILYNSLPSTRFPSSMGATLDI